jgi:glucose/mannose transport system substrate-binding protein
MTTKRPWLRTLVAAFAVLALASATAACGDDDDGDDAGGGGGATEVEVFSWWTGGGEAAGLDAMIEIWKSEHPDIEFVNAAVAGGAGTNAKAVLAQRLEADDPPDSFQGHAGAELSDYIAAGQVEDLTFLYDELGLTDVFPQDLLDQLTVDGKIYSVPVNIHRANVLWYSPTVLEQAGVAEPPTTFDDWFAAMDKVKAAGMTPLALGEQWTVKHLMETVLLGTLGADGYAALWTADADWTAPEVTDALDTFAKLLTYANSDFASLTWQDAAKQVGDGKAAFNVMGDWADGYFQELDLEPNTDYGWTTTPGTEGIYQWLSDSFTLAKGAPHRDAAIEWLKLCASAEGQDAFNPVKGSIPARTDADVSLYGPYLKTALDDWSTATLAGSLTHGVVANNAWNTEIDGALGLFLDSRDVGALQSALADAFGTYGPEA